MTPNYSLRDAVAMHESVWADRSTCAVHYPVPCDCENDDEC
jgi:hypothetical protein